MTQILVEKDEGISVLRLSGGFIGGEETDAVRFRLNELSNDDLIVDLGEVTYMNSTALGILISAQSEFIKKDHQIVLINANETVSDLLKVTQLTLVFKVFENIKEAKNFINN